MKNSVFQALAEAARTGEPVALGIVTRVKGSSPQKVGAKALFYRDGRIKGTIGGGCLEAEIQRRALQSLQTGKPADFDLLLDHDFGWDDGLICGGKVCGVILPNAQGAGESLWHELAERKGAISWAVQNDFSICSSQAKEAQTQRSECGGQRSEPPYTGSYREGLLYEETVRPPCALWIAGAGHIAQAVAPLALRLDFGVTVFDDRPALVNQQYFPSETSLIADAWDAMLTIPLPEVPGFGLIVTRGHRHDALVLRDWIHKPFVFIGMIGSARKARTIREHFLAEKIASEQDFEKVACPVGLPILAQSVPEIAVSIMAQFVQKRAQAGDAAKH